MQVFEIVLEVRFVGRARQPVHTGSGVLLEFAERLPEEINADVVRSE